MEKNQDEEVRLPWYRRMLGFGHLTGWKLLVANLGAMIVAGLLLLWLSMGWLDLYTRHNGSLRMPDIKGMTQEEAMERLENDHLYMEITDSIYVEGEVPGVILETTPKAGTLIKSKRTIYVTVNTLSVKSIAIPTYEGLSERSVEMILKGAGFANISKVYVAGPHDQLVLHIIDATGRYLVAGERVPYDTRVVMEVSSSEAYEAAMLDSLTWIGVDSALSSPSATTSTTPAPRKSTTTEDPDNWF